VVCDVKMRSSLASSGDFMLLQKKVWRGGGAYDTVQHVQSPRINMNS